MTENSTRELLEEVRRHIITFAPHVAKRKSSQLLMSCYSRMKELVAVLEELISAQSSIGPHVLKKEMWDRITEKAKQLIDYSEDGPTSYWIKKD